MSQYYIYKIVSDDCPEFIYVGSTKSLTDRKYSHKQTCNKPNKRNHNCKVYQTIRENGGWENWRMVIVEECGDISKIQARIREEHFRMEFNANMNSCKAFISEDDKKEREKQYREDNKDTIKEQKKQYYETNKDKLKEHMKQYYEANKDKFKEINKQYHEANKDTRNIYFKQYREANKNKINEKSEIINEKQREKVTCECGCVVCKNFLSRHKKTQKHIDLLAKK